MKKFRLLALTLVLIMMFSTVMGCGSNKDTADAEATDEETTVEDTTETVEETEKEYLYTSTYSYDLNKKIYPISDETEAMLIEKLSGLTLKKNDEIDFSTLSFKEDEQKACDKLKAVFMRAMLTQNNDGNKIKSDYLDYVKIESIDDLDTGLVFNFKMGHGFKFTGPSTYIESEEFKYSSFPIPDETKELIVNKLDGLIFNKGDELDMDSLYTVSQEIMDRVIKKYDQAGNGEVSLTDEEVKEHAKYQMKGLIKQLLSKSGFNYKSGSSSDNILLCNTSEVRLYVKDKGDFLYFFIKVY